MKAQHYGCCSEGGESVMSKQKHVKNCSDDYQLAVRPGIRHGLGVKLDTQWLSDQMRESAIIASKNCRLQKTHPVKPLKLIGHFSWRISNTKSCLSHNQKDAEWNHECIAPPKSCLSLQYCCCKRNYKYLPQMFITASVLKSSPSIHTGDLNCEHISTPDNLRSWYQSSHLAVIRTRLLAQ